MNFLELSEQDLFVLARCLSCHPSTSMKALSCCHRRQLFLHSYLARLPVSLIIRSSVPLPHCALACLSLSSPWKMFKCVVCGFVFVYFFEVTIALAGLLRPMANDPSFGNWYWYQNFVPESLIMCHAFWYH